MISLTKKSNHAIAGFTVVELMVTLSLAAILTAVAVPAFNQIATTNRLAAQTNELISIITFTRSEAISKNNRFVLCRAATAVAAACAGSTANWNHWIIRNAAGGIVRRGTIGNGGDAVVVSSTLSADAVTFDSDGLALTGGEMVNTADDDAHYFRVCSDRQTDQNIRTLVLGSGSRVTTTKSSGTC
jgi:type IV fimbrial biogenesis protein FimT